MEALGGRITEIAGEGEDLGWTTGFTRKMVAFHPGGHLTRFGKHIEIKFDSGRVVGQ